MGKYTSKEIFASANKYGGSMAAGLEFYQTDDHLEDYDNRKLGFPQLDELLGGGIRTGLYCIGAMSGLGKTTFMLQAAEQLSDAGNTVLVFSLEMKKRDLQHKAVSRQSYILKGERPFTYDDLNRKDKRQTFSESDRAYLLRCADKMAEKNRNVIIRCRMDEENADLRWSAEYIYDYVREWIQDGNPKPVVIVDYLQILNTPEYLESDKAKVDHIVSGMVRLSHNLDIPVFLISSINRSNYHASIDMQAFKESGSIEYSSDVVLGIQYRGQGEKGFDIKQARAESPRNIEIVVIKQRNGPVGVSVPVHYYAEYNFFEECNSPFRKKQPFK